MDEEPTLPIDPARAADLARVPRYDGRPASLKAAGEDPEELQRHRPSKIMELHLGASIRDLTLLRGLPLKKLDLANCPEPIDLSPLVDCPELETLILPPKATKVASMRGQPKLQAVSFRNRNNGDFIRPAKSAEQFWNEYDAQQKGTGK